MQRKPRFSAKRVFIKVPRTDLGHPFHYFEVEQAGSAVTIVTPFDEELAKLSAKLDDTHLYYGSKEADYSFLCPYHL
ncbi:MAG: hypothetical protein ACREU8_12015 [Gammaproteobacteria bacterium]